MKVCLLGLDSAAHEIILHDERLKNIRCLMEAGVYGRLESVIAPTSVPAWMCMAASQDPGSLGVYGSRSRGGCSYDQLSFANSSSSQALTIWDQFGREGKRSILVGVPPSYPPRPINGISIGCFLTPDTTSTEFTYPGHIKDKIRELVGEYPVDVKNSGNYDKDQLKQQIFEMSRKQWAVVRWLLKEQEWDYFQFVDIGLERIQHAFWNYFDKQHKDYVSGNPYEDVIPEYYLWLDEQIGQVLDLLDNDTIVLIMSGHGPHRFDGAVAINEWLLREGLLVLDEYPETITSFDQLKVNWTKTKVWSEGGYDARLFFNLNGPEPDGVITDCGAFQDAMKTRLESHKDLQDLQLRVFKPDDVYRCTRNTAPELLVHFAGLSWRSIDSVGHRSIVLHENDFRTDACNHSQFGAFILSFPNCSVHGRYDGALLIDVAPSLLQCAGLQVPQSMCGKALFDSAINGEVQFEKEQEDKLTDRLRGLGYV